jgi:3-mercaptopyruvate sulfurtransferase SseA
MRFASFFLILAIATVLGLANGYRCGVSILDRPKSPMAIQLPPGVEAIRLAEAREAFDLGSHFFVDSRTEKRFGAGHIDDASSLPHNGFVDAFRLVDPPMTPDMPLIIYGEDGEDSSAPQVASELQRLGFKDIRVLVEGWRGWNEQASD